MNKEIHVVIMAGGSGTRFWPYSRNSKPKQFLDILGTGRSLLQMTFDRFSGYVENDRIWVVSNGSYGPIIQEQLPGLNQEQILLEPAKRNTAPCIAYAAYKIEKNNPNAVIIVVPADAAVFNTEKYINTINTAVESAAEHERLITIGIQPHRPETGYGYIQFIESDQEVKKVKTFTEKPSMDLAQKFIESGDFVWNAGIFVWSVKSLIKSFENYQPEIAELFRECTEHFDSTQEKNAIERTYSQCKSISIDYAIMEKAENVYVVLGDFGWSDLGSWDALHELKSKDEHGNVIEQNAMIYNSQHNYIKSAKNKLVVVSDLEGYLVADFDDVLLICLKDDAPRFKNFVKEVRAAKGDKYI
jgi:mannose-1-phosphate guanylyltransferase